MRLPSREGIPPYFYKYRSLAGCGREWTRQTLLTNQFYWDSPLSFNDPFDCAPVYEPPNREQRAKIAERMVLQHEPDLSFAERRMREREFIDASEQDMKDALHIKTPSVMRQTAVYSMATEWDNVLMWSHYASQHEGACLRFQSKSLMDAFAPTALPVQYSEDRPVVTAGIEDTRGYAEKALLTKANYWAYEKEWRFIHYLGGTGFRDFPPEALDAIVLGARTSRAVEQEVRTWIAQRTSPTRLFKAHFDERLFRLNIHEQELGSHASHA